MSNKVNWSKILIRCSSLGSLFTEPQSKAAKDAGELSKTAKSHLKRVYVLEKYGRDKDIVTKQIAKGIEVEEESITLLASVQKKMIVKNTERLFNDYLTGLPDIFEGKEISKAISITDIKSSYDLWTFMDNVGEDLNKDYALQVQGYMYLSGAKIAYIAYCLVDTPAYQVEGAKFKLLQSMNVISDLDEGFMAQAAKIELNMTFNDIPKEERVLIFTVQRDEEIIKKIESKVKMARLYLAELEKEHLATGYKK